MRMHHQTLTSVSAIVEPLEQRRLPSEAAVIAAPAHVSPQTAQNDPPATTPTTTTRITPVVQIDPAGNLTVTHATYAEDVVLFGVLAQNGIGYVPGGEFQFNTGPNPNNLYPGISVQGEGNWFWT